MYSDYSNIKINPCDSGIKIYRIGVLRKSASTSPYFTIYPAKDSTTTCDNTPVINNGKNPRLSLLFMCVEIVAETSTTAGISSSDSKVGLIVGLCIAGVVVLIVVVSVTFHYVQKRSFRKDDITLTPAPPSKLPQALSLKTVA